MSEHTSSVDREEGRAANVAADPLRFIHANMRAAPVSTLATVRLYAPHPGSGLSRIGGTRRRSLAPYWAYPWAGGLALARYVEARPEVVSGRRIIDFGSGSGLVAIVAMLHGASHALAVDSDPFSRAAIAANATLNGTPVTVARRLAPDAADLVLAGDVFYAAGVGRRALAVLDRCRAAGMTVLVGDPYRPHLPRSRLRRLAEYDVPDVGSGSAIVPSGVFELEDDG